MILTLRQIAETAAFASARSLSLIEGRSPVSAAHLQDYWTASRGRFIDWTRQLDSFTARAAGGTPESHLEIWRDAEPLCREIFVSEMLTRVWAAVLNAADLHRGERNCGPIGVHTFNGHLQIRNRVMALMLNELQVPIVEMAGLDRIRRRSERWSDLLVGHLVLNYQLDEFAFESARSIEFGQSQMREILRATDEPVWDFILAGMRLAFPGQSDEPLPSDLWNRGLVRSILGAFPPDCFDESGSFKSLRRIRIERNNEAANSNRRSLERPISSVERPETPSRLRFAALMRRLDHLEN